MVMSYESLLFEFRMRSHRALHTSPTEPLLEIGYLHCDFVFWNTASTILLAPRSGLGGGKTRASKVLREPHTVHQFLAKGD